MMWQKNVIIKQSLNLNYQMKKWRELKINYFVLYLGKQKVNEKKMMKFSESFIIQRKFVLVNSFYLICV